MHKSFRFALYVEQLRVYASCIYKDLKRDLYMHSNMHIQGAKRQNTRGKRPAIESWDAYMAHFHWLMTFQHF